MQSKIPEKIPPSKYCRQLAAAKKYDCDFKFYDELGEQLKALELWDEYNVVQNLKEQVMRIKQMTIMHAKSLDQDQTSDERQVRQIAENIKQALLSLDTSSIPKIIEKMDSTHGDSITRLVLEQVSKQESGKYSETIVKLFKSIHNPQIRTENILLVGLFYLINSQNAEKMINTYKTLIQKSMEELKKFKTQIFEILRESAKQIVNDAKFRIFVEGTKVIFKLTVNLYDVFRILSGQSNLKLKLSTLRSQLNQSIYHLNQEFNTKFHPIQQQSLQLNKRELKSYIQYLRSKDQSEGQALRTSLCSFCMLADNLVSTSNRIVHVNCWNIIKTLFKN